MKALVYERFGQPDVIELQEVAKPDVTPDGVLVRVMAASVNPADWHRLTGTPYLARPAFGFFRPKDHRLGIDFAGMVEQVGEDVTEFKPGDQVFGGRSGALAEYVCVPAGKAIVHKPANVSFEEAAAVPVAGVTALQGLRDKGGIKAGQKVLINGASGGVGTFAVQIARAFGAEVTGVCSARNVEMVRSLGADRVIDYAREDFTRGGDLYDLMLDVAGSRPWSQVRRVLAPDAAYVIVGGPKTNPLLGPLSRSFAVSLTSRGASQKVVTFFLAQLTKDDLRVLGEMLAAGTVKPVVEKTFALSEAREAFRYMGGGHARAKIVVDVSAA